MSSTHSQKNYSVSFDQYTRYETFRRIIDTNRKIGQIFKILDVGGRGNLLKDFLPKDQVFYLEYEYDPPFHEPNFIKGDGCSMEFKDNSYDWVTSADVFEHIPEDRRLNFLNEQLRVCKEGFILSAPFYSLDVFEAETRLNEYYKLLNDGKPNPWIQEHLDNGLPKENVIEKFLKHKNIFFQKIYNNELFVHEDLLKLNFFYDFFPEELKETINKINKFYVDKIYPSDNSVKKFSNYRIIYFVKKNPALKDLSFDALDPSEQKVVTVKSQEFIQETLFEILTIITLAGKNFRQKTHDQQFRYEQFKEQKENELNELARCRENAEKELRRYNRKGVKLLLKLQEKIKK